MGMYEQKNHQDDQRSQKTDGVHQRIRKEVYKMKTTATSDKKNNDFSWVPDYRCALLGDAVLQFARRLVKEGVLERPQTEQEETT